MRKMKTTVEMAELKYPKEEGWLTFGYSTIAAVMQQWRTMCWMRVK